MIDKVVHSALGLGAMLAVVFAYFFIYINATYLIWTIPLILATGKELYDLFTHGKPDYKDVFATLNPMIVIKWYKQQVKK